MSTVNVGRLTANTKLNIPSYTQAQIDALDVETGMVVWNSTEEQVQIYYGEWAAIGGTFTSAAGSAASATGGSMRKQVVIWFTSLLEPTPSKLLVEIF